MPASNFSYDGVHVFLTYPQCPLEREQLRDFFIRLEPLCKFYIARELHGDGNYHLHAYIHFGRRRRWCSGDCFDVEGYHPNIQRPRSAKHVVAYCAKDDDQPLANFTPGSLPGERSWANVLDEADGEASFLSLARQQFPRDYVLCNRQLLEFCAWYFPKVEVTYAGRRRDEFVEPNSLTEWVSENISQVYPLRLPPPLRVLA